MDPRSPRSATPAEEYLFLSLQHAADRLLQGVELLLKSHGLSPAQYNVLRILRGAGSAGLSCRDISARMITRDPDMTRLLDRLDKLGFISRERAKNDRRVVTTRITPRALELLKRLDDPMRELHRRQLRSLPAPRLKLLGQLIEELLAPAATRERDSRKHK